MYKRPQLLKLDKHLSGKRKFIQIISGPRQVGKTTMILQFLDKTSIPSYYASADAANTSQIWISQQWETARIKLRLSGSKEFLFVIDEVQKIDNWSEIIKKHWDEDSRTKIPLKIILLGSSRLLLQKGLTESLTGRFETIYMGHWPFIEMHKAFGWKPRQYIWFGGYPGAAELIEDEKRWKQYVKDSIIETSISKDILMLTRINKPALMKRLFELGCSHSGQILSFTKILGQLTDAGNATTLSHYLDLLDTAGLLAGIEKYAGSKISQRSSSPKFLVHNTALVSSQRAETFKEISSQPGQWGRIVESAVGAHLLNLSLSGDFTLYYWREGNNEMDFVLRKGKSIIGLEITAEAKHTRSGTWSFKKKFSSAKVFNVGMSGLLLEEFLQLDPNELF